MAVSDAAKKTRKPKAEIEVAKAVSILTRMGGIRTYEFDEIIRKGGGFKVYQEMVRDERVWTGLRRVKGPIAALPWSVEPFRESLDDEPAAENVQAAQFVDYCLRNIQGHFSKDIWDLLDAFDCGHSITEIIYESVVDGKWAGKIGLKSLKAKNPENFELVTDDYFNLIGLKNFAGTTGQGEDLDPAKFVIFSPLARYEDPHGWSLLRSAYRHFWIKDTALKLRCVFMERLASGTVIAKYPDGRADLFAKMQEVVKTYKGETGIVIPASVELEVIEFATKGETEFQKFIADCNESILIAIVGSTLDTQEGTKTGALLATTVHRDTADISVELFANWLGDTLTEQLAEPLTRLNFATARRPSIILQTEKPKDLAGTATALDTIVNRLKLPVPSRWAREQLGIPEPAEGEDVLEGAPAPQPIAPMGPIRPIDDNPEATARGQQPPDGKQKPGKEQFAEPADPFPAQQSGGGDGGDEADLRFTKIDRVAQTLNGLFANSMRDGVQAFGAAFESVSKPARKILATGDVAALGDLRPDMTALRLLMAKLFLTAHLDGMMHSVEEMRREWKSEAPRSEPFPKFEKFAEPTDAAQQGELLTIAGAARKFAGKVPLTREQFDGLVESSRDQAVFVTGLSADEIAQDIKPLLKQAIDKGWTWEQFRTQLEGKAEAYAGTAFGTGVMELAKDAWHAETVFRTNIMTSYNEGRRDAFEDPELAGAFPAWQYVAVLDNRTRETHARQNGKVYLADDSYWDEWYPPNGFNCRCIVIPISVHRFDDSMLSEPTYELADPGFGKVG